MQPDRDLRCCWVSAPQVESCFWRDSSACCKIIKLSNVYDEAMLQKIVFGVEAGLLASLCHPYIIQTYKIYHVLSGQPGNVNNCDLEAIWLIQVTHPRVTIYTPPPPSMLCPACHFCDVIAMYW